VDRLEATIGSVSVRMWIFSERRSIRFLQTVFCLYSSHDAQRSSGDLTCGIDRRYLRFYTDECVRMTLVDETCDEKHCLVLNRMSLDEHAKEDPSLMNSAIFYSISSTQPGSFHLLLLSERMVFSRSERNRTRQFVD
jgi:hypothetical protein